ncbi:hypothetical protein JVU11DRAFT_1540 [Chiua virens]|nr:hypothetical protein JVU11DRAFT_1540 [Chiua virens]
MIYGRVIGNELRDVPPECLPVWGQRWAGYRTPQGPSPFSTRILSVDQMSEVGPILTSPTQFERTLMEEDEGVDTGSESSPVYSAFPLSPLTIRTDVTELSSQIETSSPSSVHPSSGHLHDSLEVSRRFTGHPLSRNSRRPRTISLSRRQFSIQHHGAEPPLHLPTVHDDLPTQRGRGLSEQEYDPWDIDYTSTSIRADLYQGNHEQLQFTIPPHSSVEWQFSDAHTQFPAYPSQPNTSSHSFTGYPSRSLQPNDRDRMIPMTPPSFTHFSALPLPQQHAGIDTPWNHDTLASGITYPRNLMIPQWPSTPPNQSFPGIQSPESISGSGVFYHLDSSFSHPEDLLGTLPHSDSHAMLSLEKPEGDHFNG